MWSKPVRSRGLDRVKKIVKSLVNACKARKQVSVCLPCISVEIRVDDFRIREKMFTNIQAWVNTVVLTPVSCPTGVWPHGQSIFAAGVNSLLIVHKVRVCRMFEITLRDLWLSWKWSWGSFVIAWVWSFWWDGFWTLKRPGKLLLTTAHAHHLDRGPNSVFCPEFFGFKCWKSFASLPCGRNRCDRAVWTGLKKLSNPLWMHVKLENRWVSVYRAFRSKFV